MKKLALVLALASPPFAAQHVIDQKTFDAIARELSGEHAQELDRRIVQKRIAASSFDLKLSNRGVLRGAPAPSPAAHRGPRATTIPPVFSELVAEWDPNANDLALFETINFMNGSRTSAEIADLLTIELGENFDAATVDRTVNWLVSQNLAVR
jgi:hypothetical protein